MIEYQRTSRLADIILALDVLQGMEAYYPDFAYWYVNQATPGILAGRDVLVIARDHGRIVGVGLGKTHKNEQKLRCIRVLPEYRKRGVGLHLIDRVLRAINCDKPICTVSEEMMHDFSRAFINYYGFSLTAVEKGMYRSDKLEYIFNAQMAA